MLNMFRTLTHPSSGACDFSIASSHWLCVLVLMCVGVSVWLVGVVSVWQAEAVLQLNMFRTLTNPSSGACDFSIVSSHWSCVLVLMCVGVSVWLVGVVSVWQAEAVLQLNMFRTLTHPLSGACDFSIVSSHWSCVLVLMCVGVSVWLVGVVSVWKAEAQLQPAPTSNNETPTHIETRTHNQCDDTIEKSQAPDDGCVNVRNMSSIEEVK